MTKKINVLIVDDSELIITNLKRILDGVQSIRSIQTATNVKAAEEIIFRDKPDLIILDIQLPDGNGLDLLTKVKAELPLIKVILFSDQIELFSELYKRRFGADYFVDKSMEFEEIANIINDKLNK